MIIDRRFEVPVELVGRFDRKGNVLIRNKDNTHIRTSHMDDLYNPYGLAGLRSAQPERDPIEIGKPGEA